MSEELERAKRCLKAGRELEQMLKEEYRKEWGEPFASLTTSDLVEKLNQRLAYIEAKIAVMEGRATPEDELIVEVHETDFSKQI